MPANTSSTTLYRIDECSDVMADACVGDDQGNLIFLSIWTRDTAVQQFLARLTLGRDEQGLDQFHVITDQGGSVPVFVSNVDRLEKRMTRAYRRTLFGSLSNVWLFDRRCVKPDKANASALALLPKGSAHRLDRLWMLVRQLPALPWKSTSSTPAVRRAHRHAIRGQRRGRGVLRCWCGSSCSWSSPAVEECLFQFAPLHSVCGFNVFSCCFRTLRHPAPPGRGRVQRRCGR